MKLKQYQEKVIDTLKIYLSALNEFKAKYNKALDFDVDLAKDYNFPKKAYEQVTGRAIYHSKSNGLQEPLPDIYLKVPTGGGKTLLACHAINQIQNTYLHKQTGLVLWVVPTSQIYRQTLLALKDRRHPYREVLDISSGGRVLIREKTEKFNRSNIEENLVVLLLMLPSANRQNRETLKVFRDQGGFTDFFPREDDFEGHKKLRELIPNLDCFSNEYEVFGTQIKTSLGNALKLLRPLVVIDEGHKAYSELSRETIRNFNPAFILELSATPPPDSNELVKITGQELHEEEMIKLDIHLTNKTSLDWEDTLLASYEKRKDLEEKAKEYEANTNEYIRPICLIQVERTGKDQRDTQYIHAEDAKEYLIRKCNVPESHIAIKSSEKDDIEGLDLFADDCEIRYIITKQALQEGWDCSFAYVLTLLTNPKSATGITQLVGRILRQPYARKTHIKALDECYVFTFRQNATTLVKEIRSGLQGEGLGDIAGRIVSDEAGTKTDSLKERTLQYRPGFKNFEGKIYLPKFVVQEKDNWRNLNFEADILSEINWENINIDEIKNLSLQNNRSKEQEIVLGLSKEEQELLKETGRLEKTGTLEIDEVFLTRHITEIVPNPWHCFNIGDKALNLLTAKYGKETVAANFVFIIEELKKILDKERNRLAEAVFKKMIESKKICFFLITDKGGFALPSRIHVKSNKQLVRNDNTPVQRSLFDYVPEENINGLEKTVAIYLDEQEKLLWWYRNMSRQDYHIQGWKRNKIYPDFLAAEKSDEVADYGTVYVLETKGIHLKNEDTRYKQDVFALCNELGAKKAWKELFDEFPNHKFEFQVVFEDEWENRINKLLE
ncbi:MAG: DEAD/DEAH box helicase family protein [Tannerella sp.]|jgi:type III restriction enzyme|nr:DEAD/DEAH box helicase family protein [Tannerella sp.]